MTQRQFLQSNAEQNDTEAIEELAALPPLPPLAAHVWATFLDLHATRSSAGMGPSRLTRLEIRAWEQDEGQALERWERRAIMAIDAAWVRIASAELSKKEAT